MTGAVFWPQDDERLEALLDSLHKKAPEPQQQNRGKTVAPKLNNVVNSLPLGVPALLSVAAQLRGARGGIAALEGRIGAHVTRASP